jgi:hypothetical protein
MTVSIREPNRKIKLPALEACEAIFGRLPSDYCAFLLAYNGGKPEKNHIKIQGTKNTASIRYFFGILGENEESDLTKKQKFYLERVPKGIIPIAYAEGGNLICLSIIPDTFGQVFFWDHELESSDGEPATWDNLFKLADSFDEFFQNLETPPEPPRLKPGEAKVWIKPGFLESLKQPPKR